MAAYKWEPKVPGKPKSNNLTVRVDDDLFRGIKELPNWQDKVRAKLEELLQEAGASSSASA